MPDTVDQFTSTKPPNIVATEDGVFVGGERPQDVDLGTGLSWGGPVPKPLEAEYLSPNEFHGRLLAIEQKFSDTVTAIEDDPDLTSRRADIKLEQAKAVRDEAIAAERADMEQRVVTFHQRNVKLLESATMTSGERAALEAVKSNVRNEIQDIVAKRGVSGLEEAVRLAMLSGDDARIDATLSAVSLLPNTLIPERHERIILDGRVRTLQRDRPQNIRVRQHANNQHLIERALEALMPPRNTRPVKFEVTVHDRGEGD